MPLLTTGCGLIATTARNAYNEPALALDECRFRHETEHLARQAWDEYQSSQPGATSCKDFRNGFLDGYTDYLRYGGTGEPNITPPDRYQRVRYQTPAGLQAISAYFQGCQQGTQAAIASGLRHQLVVPILVRVPDSAPVTLPATPPPELLSPPKPLSATPP